MKSKGAMMNTISQKEKSIIFEYTAKSPPLPYPLSRRRTYDGGDTLIYEIPSEELKDVLRELYFLVPVPDMEQVILDVHEEKRFLFRDSLVAREDEYNFIVSPYYIRSGGTILDFIIEEDVIDSSHFLFMRGVSGRRDSVITDNLTKTDADHSSFPFGNR